MEEKVRRAEDRAKKALMLLPVISGLLIVLPGLFLLFGAMTVSPGTVLGSVAMAAVGAMGLRITRRLIS